MGGKQLPETLTLIRDNILQYDNPLAVSARENAARLHKAMQEVLTDRELLVVQLRYGLGGRKPLTQREVAQQCGISRSYILHRYYCK